MKGIKSSMKSGYLLRIFLSAFKVSVVTYAIWSDMKLRRCPATVLAIFGSLIAIVEKHAIDLRAISAFTSVTYSLSSFTISDMLLVLVTCARISSLRCFM
jgi:hypothetical protein